MARLEIRKLKRVSRIEVGDHPITIGRSSCNRIVLRDQLVSREHCVIEMTDGQLRVRDLSSRTGTMVNGIRVNESLLHHRDHIAIGPFVIVLRDGSMASLPTHDEEGPAEPETVQPSDAASAREQVITTQAAQIAELTSAASALHHELKEHADRIVFLQADHESMVQRLRHIEATRQTALQKVEHAEDRLNIMISQIDQVRPASERLARLQEEIAKTEEQWTEADERMNAGEADEEAGRQRDSLNASLDMLHQQRDQAIAELHRLLQHLHATAEQRPRSHQPGRSVESKVNGSSRRWWRFGVKQRT